ncbi:MAG: glycosyltransferase [Proteobacteria bacterium]|nr:glycosyltransferase [Pseudomonadota bacterium]
MHLRSYNLLRGVALENEVDLIAFAQIPWLEVFYGSVERGLAECEVALAPLCRSVKFLPIERLQRPAGKPLTALEGLVTPGGYTVRWLDGSAARKAFADVGAKGYDLAHFDTVGLVPFRKLVECQAATLGHHNVESQMMLRRASNERQALKKAYFLWEGRKLQHYERKMAPTFAANIMCSDLDGARLRELAPGARTITVPNGVDIDYFTPADAPSDEQRVIFVGSLNWYPNVDAVLFLLREIWPRLKARMPRLQLDVVGSAPPQSIVDAAASLDGVCVHGFVDDVRPYLRRAAVYICPIRDGGGTKLKLLDAFAMGKCVVAHPIACEGIDVIQGVHVELARGAEDFARVVQELLSDPARRARMGTSARQLAVEAYSFKSISAALARIFRSLVAGRQA